MTAELVTFEEALALNTLSPSHELVQVVRGRRSGIAIIVALHSTALGPAAGGCRIAHYPGPGAAVADALRLAAAMTEKNALAGLRHGGGKTVVALPAAERPSGAERTALLHDVGDTIQALGGRYVTGPDVGSGPADMTVIGERTAHVCCRPVEDGGSGDSSLHTARGTLAALGAVAQEAFGSPELRGLTVGVIGLGAVGGRLARLLERAGARLIVTDTAPAARRAAAELGATWVDPDDALAAEVDILVPAALGGLLTAHTVPRLRCAAVAGPANNQLDTPATAELLAARGILWAPDVVVSAGGVIHATGVELRHEPEEETAGRLTGIADTLREVFRIARDQGSTPARAAAELAARRVREGVLSLSGEVAP
ncbi:Glu/Leu/Phe/Val dehydrogenase dimerization domain-containing protein [Streptomyces sp. VRA16 Mangrove soil]|uniref:Glu/Leu/Phe/Val dehydrogenase dimerization domain-containing protein n=1 Tax=Streptomyces sp. VRA16 Mangrove soil TaxID=2817434 RepID=UPI001A9F2A71|nr:Glu/Leu/Phe/Val dehydrogenase dimerization domain-containing protein [Streptomyces sp. VRA16 Mangrove soil]MBO1329960.1 Glu/Leu/Phe/Val dehydrogenase [Streptomyces sp. VRA16 Mangrove soil]